VEVDERTFNIDPSAIEKAISPRTKAIVPVHLFGQCADMQPILDIAKKYNLFVIEDTAQAIGAEYTMSDGKKLQAGTIGDVSGTSFFPSKNLGCFGDGGAIFTPREELAQQLRMIANHGQSKLYYHDVVGVNSRLDSMQAAVLNVKLKYLDDYAAARRQAAAHYDAAFAGMEQIAVPYRAPYSTHVFHQYTLTLSERTDRDALKDHLQAKGIPSKVYYPVPLHLQKAYNLKGYKAGDFPVAEKLCRTVLSLPMHTELDEEQLQFISGSVIEFCKR
jgi:dTDP-4-amino-4,6-dideoxygalactose transaminase